MSGLNLVTNREFYNITLAHNERNISGISVLIEHGEYYKENLLPSITQHACITLQKQLGCFNHRVVTLVNCRQTDETVHDPL